MTQMNGYSPSRPWYKEPVDKANVGCLNCGAPPIVMERYRRLSVGFGQVMVTKDDECLWGGDDWDVSAEPYSVMAEQDPDHDWRIYYCSPMYEAEYQRQGEGEWILVKKGEGFA